jgi:hypothetical protein
MEYSAARELVADQLERALELFDDNMELKAGATAPPQILELMAAMALEKSKSAAANRPLSPPPSAPEDDCSRAAATQDAPKDADNTTVDTAQPRPQKFLFRWQTTLGDDFSPPEERSVEMFRDPVAAQKEPGVLMHARFSDADLRLFHELGAEAAAHKLERRRDPAPPPALQHTVVYLQAQRLIQTKAPQLLAKLVHTMRSADACTEGWRAWGEAFTPRVVEYHTYTEGGGLTKKHHFDEGSCYTMVVMLSQPGEDFQGGDFKTWESDGSWKVHPLRRGDCLVIPSYKFHSVSPVTGGRRNVAIIEVWDGPEGETDERPMPPVPEGGAKTGDESGWEDDYTA